ncbi:MAG: ogt1 [Bacteriovoracaceae bacterium]|nr:ogt1 [Bacteriovoracaceae bacterium]
MKLISKKIKSPIGELTLIANEKSLVTILLPKGKLSKSKLLSQAEKGDNSVLKKTEKQLNEYFTGRRKNFDLPLEASGTDFQKIVWKALYKIPFGVTKSYGDIADEIGSPKASRAVGGANGRNPIPIVVPCHRVIGANGTLTGFGGGLNTKSFLLELEGREQQM